MPQPQGSLCEVKAPLAAQRRDTGTAADAAAGTCESACNGDGGTGVCFAPRLSGGTAARVPPLVSSSKKRAAVSRHPVVRSVDDPAGTESAGGLAATYQPQVPPVRCLVTYSQMDCETRPCVRCWRHSVAFSPLQETLFHSSPWQPWHTVVRGFWKAGSP
jgi:hypothetical protein